MPARAGHSVERSVCWVRGHLSPHSGPCHQIGKRIPRSYWISSSLQHARSHSLVLSSEYPAGFFFTPTSILTSLCT